jgi:hypothetical protein
MWVALAVVVVAAAAVGAYTKTVTQRHNTKSAIAKSSDASNLQKDLGVAIKPKVQDLVYVKKDNAAFLTSKSLIEASGGACSADTRALGSYIKVDKSTLQDDDSPDPWWMRKSAVAEATKPSAEGPPKAKEFADYYLVYVSPQYPCGSSSKADKLQSEQAKAAGEGIPTAE